MKVFQKKIQTEEPQRSLRSEENNWKNIDFSLSIAVIVQPSYTYYLLLHFFFNFYSTVYICLAQIVMAFLI